MKLSDLSNMDLCYLEGFVKSCAAKGIDPELLLGRIQKEAAPEPKKARKPKAPVAPQLPAVDYEKRRRAINVVLGAVTGMIGGASMGAKAMSPQGQPGKGTLIGAGVGGAVGAGAGAIANLVRNYLGFSAMGQPVTAGKDMQAPV